MRRCLIAYDVATLKTRNALARRLEKAGRRIQKSVFVVEGSLPALQRLEHELHLLLNQGDSLLILPICASCLASATLYGEPAPVMLMA